MKTKLQESNMNSQVSAATLAPPKTRDSHRQLGMQTNQWTAKVTSSVSRDFFPNLCFYQLSQCRRGDKQTLTLIFIFLHFLIYLVTFANHFVTPLTATVTYLLWIRVT